MTEDSERPERGYRPLQESAEPTSRSVAQSAGGPSAQPFVPAQRPTGAEPPAPAGPQPFAAGNAASPHRYAKTAAGEPGAPSTDPYASSWARFAATGASGAATSSPADGPAGSPTGAAGSPTGGAESYRFEPAAAGGDAQRQPESPWAAVPHQTPSTNATGAGADSVPARLHGPASTARSGIGPASGYGMADTSQPARGYGAADSSRAASGTAGGYGTADSSRAASGTAGGYGTADSYRAASGTAGGYGTADSYQAADGYGQAGPQAGETPGWYGAAGGYGVAGSPGPVGGAADVYAPPDGTPGYANRLAPSGGGYPERAASDGPYVFADPQPAWNEGAPGGDPPPAWNEGAPGGSRGADSFGLPVTGRRIEPSPPPQTNRFGRGLLAGLAAGLLVFGAAGWFVGRATAPEATTAATQATTKTAPAGAAGGLGAFERSQVTVNRPDFAGTGLTKISQGWLPYLSSCARSGQPSGPALNRGEKVRVRCTLDGMSALFVEYDSIAQRDAARQKMIDQGVGGAELAPGVRPAGQRPAPSGRTDGNYVEFAYRLTEDGKTRTVSGLWWDDDQSPIAGYLLAFWKEGIGGSWEPMRDLWSRYA